MSVRDKKSANDSRQVAGESHGRDELYPHGFSVAGADLSVIVWIYQCEKAYLDRLDQVQKREDQKSLFAGAGAAVSGLAGAVGCLMASPSLSLAFATAGGVGLVVLGRKAIRHIRASGRMGEEMLRHQFHKAAIEADILRRLNVGKKPSSSDYVGTALNQP